MNNEGFFSFHSQLMGYSLYKGHKWIPKYVAYWSGYDAENCLLGQNRIKAIRD